jgi:cell division protein FtsB
MAKKKRRVILLFIFLVIILLIFLPGYNKLQNLRARNEMLRKRIEELKKSNVELEQEIVKLKTDPEYMEKVAREELGVVKEGEIIYKILPPVKE